ncbi:MAG: hypothetical protein WEB94_00580 [Candidatus Paceibacterota bacterium]
MAIAIAAAIPGSSAHASNLVFPTTPLTQQVQLPDKVLGQSVAVLSEALPFSTATSSARNDPEQWCTPYSSVPASILVSDGHPGFSTTIKTTADARSSSGEMTPVAAAHIRTTKADNVGFGSNHVNPPTGTHLLI